MRTDEITGSPFPFNTKHMVLLQTRKVVKMRPCPITEYNIYIGNNTKRIYAKNKLPPFIQSKLAMINTVPKEEWNGYFDDDIFFEGGCYQFKRFTKNNPQFKHIGWQVSDSIYVIIMSEDELSELKGITVDTRKKSQDKSKKIS